MVAFESGAISNMDIKLLMDEQRKRKQVEDLLNQDSEKRQNFYANINAGPPQDPEVLKEQLPPENNDLTESEAIDKIKSLVQEDADIYHRHVDTDEQKKKRFALIKQNLNTTL